MTDTQFDGYPTDARFPTPGVDNEHDGYPADGRFPSPGEDTRFGGGGATLPAVELALGQYVFNDGTVTTSDGTAVTGVVGELGPKLTSAGGPFVYYPQYDAIDGEGSFNTNVLTAPVTFTDGTKYSFFGVGSNQVENRPDPIQSMGVGCWADAGTGAQAAEIGMITPDNSQAKLRMHGLNGVTSSTQDYPKDGSKFAFGFAMHQGGNSINAWFSMGDEVIQGTSDAGTNPATAISIAGQAAWPMMLHEVIWYDAQLDKTTGDAVMDYLKAKWLP